MKYRTITMCLMLSMVHSLDATAVIFLEGTSRSGKSSISDAIRQYENWASVSSLYLYYCHDVFNTIAPTAFACLSAHIERENITHAITKNIFIFKDNVQEEQKKETRQAVKRIQDYFDDPVFCTRHMEEFSDFTLTIIRSHLNNGLNVLADTGWYVTQEQVRHIKPTPMIATALAYCPFNIVIERIIHRNKLSLETGNIMNYRFFKEPLKSFEALYDLSADAINAIDTLEKTTFLKCLDAIALCLPNAVEQHSSSEFIMQDFTGEQLQEYRELFIKQFEDHETLYVTPKKTYDIVLRTDTYTPQECAEHIRAYIDMINSIK